MSEMIDSFADARKLRVAIHNWIKRPDTPLTVKFAVKPLDVEALIIEILAALSTSSVSDEQGAHSE